MQDAILQRFQRFKSMFLSSNLPCNELLELVESYITSSNQDPTVEEIPILSGQLSLSDVA